MKKFILPILLAGGLMFTSCGGDAPAPEKVLESFSISGEYKTDYYINDELDYEGMVLKATYNDNSVKDVSPYSVVWDFDFSVKAESTTVTGTYTEKGVSKSASFTVSVSEKTQEVHDITITMTATGITTYEDDHQKIYINTSLLADPDSGNWGSLALTQDTENPNEWSIVIEDVTLGSNYFYSFYYGGATEEDIEWHDGHCDDLDDGANHTLETSEGIYDYDTGSHSFEVKEITGSVDVTVQVTPLVLKTADSESEPLNEGVYVWAWNNIEGGNAGVKFTLNTENNLWEYTFTIPLSEGAGSIQMTFVLGNASAANWTYQWGNYEPDWTTWNSSSYNVTSETTTLAVSPKFNDQPAAVVPEDNYQVSFILTTTNESDFTWGNVLTGTGPTTTFATTWGESFAYDATKEIYVAKQEFAKDTTSVNFCYIFGKWTLEDGAVYDKAYVAAESSFIYTLTFDQLGDVTVHITVDKIDGNGLFVGTVSEATNCTVSVMSADQEAKYE